MALYFTVKLPEPRTLASVTTPVLPGQEVGNNDTVLRWWHSRPPRVPARWCLPRAWLPHTYPSACQVLHPHAFSDISLAVSGPSLRVTFPHLYRSMCGVSQSLQMVWALEWAHSPSLLTSALCRQGLMVCVSCFRLRPEAESMPFLHRLSAS